MISLVICVIVSFDTRSKYTPLALAATIYTGLFINFYTLIDEVSINLEHAYNLYNYGRFSMSPELNVQARTRFVTFVGVICVALLCR